MNTTLAQRLRLVRGKTPQAGFAGKVGIYKSAWGRYERGEGEPVGSDLIKICSVCDINPQWLLLGQGLMPQRMPALPRAALDLLLCCTYFCTKGSPP